jgi:hypothetical protein
MNHDWMGHGVPLFDPFSDRPLSPIHRWRKIYTGTVGQPIVLGLIVQTETSKCVESAFNL